jgi:hypothetical protein
VETIYRQSQPSRDCHTRPLTLPSIVLPYAVNPPINYHAQPTLPHLSYTATLLSDRWVTGPILKEHRTSCNNDFQRHLAPRYGLFQRGSKPASQLASGVWCVWRQTSLPDGWNFLMEILVLEGILVLEEEIPVLEQEILVHVLGAGILPSSHVGLIDYGCPLLP